MATTAVEAEKKVLLKAEQRVKALRAKTPTPDQTKLLNLWSDVEGTLTDHMLENPSDHFLESEADLAEICLENGQIWLKVIDHRAFKIPLGEFAGSGKLLAVLKKKIMHLASSEVVQQTGIS